MKMKMSVIVMGIFLLFMAACSNNETSGEQNESADNGSSEQKDLKIGLTLNNLANPFFVSMSEAAEEYADELGAEIVVQAADADLAKQTSQIEDFITQGVDLILLNAVDSEGIAGAVAQADAAGIPVVSVDVGADGGIEGTVTSDNYQAGVLAAEYMIEDLGGQGNVVVIDGPPVTAVKDRIAGFEDTIEGTDIEVIAKQNGEGNREKGLQVMESILQANEPGTIDAVFANNDPVAIGAEIAQQQADRQDEFYIVGVDGSPDVIEAMSKEGSSIAGTSAQHPDEMVKKAMDVGIQVLDGESVEEVIKIPVDLVTQDNLDSYEGW
ncbi:ribose ABC superfamily ATP-binding protein [Halobacillus andaensis]|uniref:Ribose ABC superfamily ATP-binding protein n=1 Tax=Halobacillus andaensis TaxID=1176239 RepID=A0A917B762_HALAA|nr:substrate-binding domain-containing protein [Halobacillus andaensis]MBP2005660.1 ribose transport system substrate-binding protein [Halobacillus andaensis]GGF26956.1 ribose ABC superfamily ATP-binding protein [Halobacillus andaensis]